MCVWGLTTEERGRRRVISQAWEVERLHTQFKTGEVKCMICSVTLSHQIIYKREARITREKGRKESSLWVLSYCFAREMRKLEVTLPK